MSPGARCPARCPARSRSIRSAHDILGRIDTPQLRDDFFAHQTDRPHQILLGQLAKIQLAEESVEDTFLRRGFDLTRHGVGRADEDQIVVDIEGNPFTFDLNQGENFYFVLYQETEGGTFVEQG